MLCYTQSHWSGNNSRWCIIIDTSFTYAAWELNQKIYTFPLRQSRNFSYCKGAQLNFLSKHYIFPFKWKCSQTSEMQKEILRFSCDIIWLMPNEIPSISLLGITQFWIYLVTADSRCCMYKCHINYQCWLRSSKHIFLSGNEN